MISHADNPVQPALVGPGLGRRVLVVDDDAVQLKLMRAHLAAAGFDVRTAGGASEALDSARLERPDAIVSDVRMTELDGFMLCHVFRSDAQFSAVPILLVTAAFEDDDDLELALSAGAERLIQRSPDFRRELDALLDVLSAGVSARSTSQPPRDAPAIRRMAIQMGRLLARSHAAEIRYRTLFENANEAIAVLTPEGLILEVNRRWEDILQLPRHRLAGHHIREFAPPGQEEQNVSTYRESIEDGDPHIPPVPISRPDGSTVYMEFSNTLVAIAGETVALTVGRDVTESVEARRSLAASEEKYRTLIEHIPDMIWSSSADGQLTFISANALKLTGFAPSEIIDAPRSWRLDRTHPDDRDHVARSFRALLVDGTPMDVEFRWQRKDGQWIWLHNRAVISHARGVLIADGLLSDITERKRLEDQVRLSQKMEAIGQLTGGIAHDFNNILAVILGSGEFLREALPLKDERRADADAIMAAGERAAALTRHLLAFSRRQVLESRPIDLNAIVRGLEPMLHRLIGEDIALSTALARDLDMVRADAGQLEQVIMNLVVNARDAMPNGGRLSIETANVMLDPSYSHTHFAATPGPYVMVAVSDSGCGMDADTKRRIFEPFFTTKDLGKGTGLGLSTCYGIVKQSNGTIWVYSEPGQGSVFKVFLPRVASQPEAKRDAVSEVPSVTGHETVLLVEDDDAVRETVRRILAGQGYRILQARDGDEAVRLLTSAESRVDIVVSDVVMPGVSGPELVNRLKQHDPSLKALFMSGYTDHAVLRDQILPDGMPFIQKPFGPAAFARKVREVIDAA